VALASAALVALAALHLPVPVLPTVLTVAQWDLVVEMPLLHPVVQ